MLKRFFSYLIVILLLFVIPFSLVSRLRDGASRLVKPLSSLLIQRSAATRNFFNSIGQIGQLRGDKQELQQQVLNLQQQLADKENILQENTSLRQELGVTNITRTMKKVFARIILQSPVDSLDHSFTIDVGRSQGVKVDQPAVYQGVLVGKVIEVRENSSIVRVVTSQKSRVQAWVVLNREKGLLVGDGNAVTLTEITQGVDIPTDSPVETSGLGGSLPQGILIGQIGASASDKINPTQSFRIKLPYDPNNLQSVFILLLDTP